MFSVWLIWIKISWPACRKWMDLYDMVMVNDYNTIAWFLFCLNIFLFSATSKGDMKMLGISLSLFFFNSWLKQFSRFSFLPVFFIFCNAWLKKFWHWITVSCTYLNTFTIHIFWIYVPIKFNFGYSRLIFLGVMALWLKKNFIELSSFHIMLWGHWNAVLLFMMWY